MTLIILLCVMKFSILVWLIASIKNAYICACIHTQIHTHTLTHTCVSHYDINDINYFTVSNEILYLCVQHTISQVGTSHTALTVLPLPVEFTLARHLRCIPPTNPFSSTTPGNRILSSPILLHIQFVLLASSGPQVSTFFRHKNL